MKTLEAVDGNGKLVLSQGEVDWLEEYGRQLQIRFPGLIEDIIVFGFRARGIADPDLDFRTLVLIREGDRATAEAISGLGYMIDASEFSVAPSIMVCTSAEWAERKRVGDPIYRSISSEGVSVV